MSGITTVERLVLESIGQSPKEIPALMQDTKLELRFLANILHALTLRSIVVRTEHGYALNQHLPSAEKQQLNDFHSRKAEVTELITGLLDPQDSPLKLKKVAMKEKDRAMLRALLKNVEDFINGLPAPGKNDPTHSWSVVVCGEDRYHNIINRLIKEV